MSIEPDEPTITFRTRVKELLARISQNTDRLIFLQTCILVLQTVIICFPVYEYWTGRLDRERTKHFQAWQLIGGASGKVGDAGRSSALEDLNADRVRLRGLEAPRARLEQVNLPDADLKFSLLDSARFIGGNFVRSSITRANMRGTNFGAADLRRSDFTFSVGDGASFRLARICDALFIATSLRNARFDSAYVTHADFTGADLRGAVFPPWAHASDMNLSHANVAGLLPAALRLEALKQGGAVEVSADSPWQAALARYEPLLKHHWPIAEMRVKNRQTPLPACGPAPNRAVTDASPPAKP